MQSFPEGIIKPYEGTILTSGKVCCVRYLLVFRLILGFTGERLIPVLRRKDWILRALLLAVTSLWSHKVGPKAEIYQARSKFILISDQAKDLVKNGVEGGLLSLIGREAQSIKALKYLVRLPLHSRFGKPRQKTIPSIVVM